MNEKQGTTQVLIKTGSGVEIRIEYEQLKEILIGFKNCQGMSYTTTITDDEASILSHTLRQFKRLP